MPCSATSRRSRSAADILDALAGLDIPYLLIAFGSLAGVRRASREELTAVVGAKTADAVLGYFAGKGP